MTDSALNMSATRADNSSVERLETEAYLLANKRSDATVKRSVRVSADHNDDTSKIEDRGTCISREVDSTLATLKPVKSSIAREAWSEQRATSNFIGDVTDAEEESYFVTGSSYKGSWDALGMTEVGRYVMPHGTAYEGEIRDGMFHGQGSLYWTKKQRLDVVHLRGKLQEHRYTFEDGLAYNDKDWSYCKFPDRRFYESIKKGLRPGGRTLKTSKPTKVIPSGCYDAGDGVFDPKTLRITSYDDTARVLRAPKKEEYDWILKNCRKSWTEPTGYRPSLNENWSDNPPDLPYNIAMSKDSPDSWWKRLTTFKRQFDTMDDEDDNDTSTEAQAEDLSVPEICLCGKYVIVGEPCNCAEVPTLFDNEVAVEDVDDTLRSVTRSSDCLDVKSIPQDCSESSIADKFLEDYKRLEKQADDAIETVQITDERTQSQYAERKEILQKPSGERHNVKDVQRVDTVEAVTVKKAATGNDKDVEEKRNDIIEQEDLRKFVTSRQEEITTRREFSVEAENRKAREEDTKEIRKKTSRRSKEKKSTVIMVNENQWSNGEMDGEQQEEDKSFHKSAKEINDKRKDVTKKNIRKADEESDDAKVDSPENLANDEFLRNFVNEEEKREQRGLPFENHDYVATVNEGPEEKTDQKFPLENHNYASASIPREKVPSVTEPETSNGRRMKSERSTVLPKGTMTERDLQFDRTGEETIRSAIVDSSVIRATKMKRENTVRPGISNKTLKSLAVNVLPAATEEKKIIEDYADGNLRRDSSDSRNLMLDEDEESANIPEDNQLNQRYYRYTDEPRESSEVTAQTKPNQYSEISKISVPASDNLTTREETFSEFDENGSSSRRLGNEMMKTMKTISDSRNVVAARVTTSKDSQSKNTNYEEPSTARSSVSFNYDLPILENLHRSLAALSSEKQKPSKECEIVEIYNKYSTISKTKSTNVNVWRLSGSMQDDEQTKMEDHLFHSTLTAPRCELIEYMRKPRGVRVCKPTLPEVQTSTSRCREEFPFNIPAKQYRSSGETVCRKK